LGGGKKKDSHNNRWPEVLKNKEATGDRFRKLGPVNEKSSEILTKRDGRVGAALARSSLSAGTVKKESHNNRVSRFLGKAKVSYILQKEGIGATSPPHAPSSGGDGTRRNSREAERSKLGGGPLQAPSSGPGVLRRATRKITQSIVSWTALKKCFPGLREKGGDPRASKGIGGIPMCGQESCLGRFHGTDFPSDTCILS